MNDFENENPGRTEGPFSTEPDKTSDNEHGTADGQYQEGDPTYHYRKDEINNENPSGYRPPYGAEQPQSGGYGGAQWQQPGYVPPQNNGGEYQYNNGYAAPQSPETGYAYSNPPADNGKNKKGKKKMTGGKIFAIVVSVLCVLLVIALVLVIVFGVNGKDKENETEADTHISENIDEFQTQPSPESGNVPSADGVLTPKGIYDKVRKSSVGILVYGENKSLASEGSGILFQESKDGKYTYIVTCAHVIAGSSKVMVQLYDSTEHEAEIVGFDTRTDIGVLRVEASGFQLAEIGDSSKIAVGDPVYAIGNPGGVEFANSFTNGMVSALDRPVNSSSSGYTMECIQHTAAINPGNSGGALVNAYGQVIGINSMKIVANDYEGMGFSVPSSVFVNIVNNIMEHGYVSNRPKLGITYVAASGLKEYGMFVAIKGLPAGSIVIHDIAPDSALAGTEAKKGDLITAVNGKDLDKTDYLPELIENSSVGDKLTLSIIRIHDDYSFDEFEVEATLVEDRGDTVANPETPEEGSSQQIPDEFEDFFKEFFGGSYPFPN